MARGHHELYPGEITMRVDMRRGGPFCLAYLSDILDGTDRSRTDDLLRVNLQYCPALSLV
jgi:hypothetical protein